MFIYFMTLLKIPQLSNYHFIFQEGILDGLSGCKCKCYWHSGTSHLRGEKSKKQNILGENCHEPLERSKITYEGNIQR